MEPLKQQSDAEKVSFWFNTNRVFEENSTTNGLSDVFDALLYLQVLYLQQAEVTRERVYAMHQSSIDGVEDMSALAELHEAAIMHNLYQRYHKDNIYVSVSSQTCVRRTGGGLITRLSAILDYCSSFAQ